LFHNHKEVIRQAEGVHITGMQLPSTGQCGHHMSILEHLTTMGKTEDGVSRSRSGHCGAQVVDGAAGHDVRMRGVVHHTHKVRGADSRLGGQGTGIYSEK